MSLLTVKYNSVCCYIRVRMVVSCQPAGRKNWHNRERVAYATRRGEVMGEYCIMGSFIICIVTKCG
jgi:hypothetical protein